MNNNPIGLFDSGMGGLSVWRVLQKRLANESLIFYGDGARCPYGSRSAEEIRRFTEEAVEQLLDRGCKLIVVACNTATAMAILPTVMLTKTLTVLTTRDCGRRDTFLTGRRAKLPPAFLSVHLTAPTEVYTKKCATAVSTV